MQKGSGLGGNKLRRMGDLKSALGASLDLREVLKEAYGLLLPLVGADYGALATSPSANVEEFQWIDCNLPPAFLRSYAEMAPHDFVLRAVRPKVGTVLRDCEMIDRAALKRNWMYHRAREVGVRLEHVMAVMLRVGHGWQCGLSLYRDRQRPFTETDQRVLQELTRDITNAVRNCLLHAKERRRSTLLQALIDEDDAAVVVVRPPAREIMRTPLAIALLDAWFEPVERDAGRLPQILLDELHKAEAARARGDGGPRLWQKDGEATSLRVEFLPLYEPNGDLVWALKLREVSRELPLPVTWARALTERQREVVAKVLLGWDDQTIANELHCELSTTKRHVRNIFTRLGVENRTKLLSWYIEIQRGS